MLKNQYTEMLWDYYKKDKKKIIPKHISMKAHKKIKEKKNKGQNPKLFPRVSDGRQHIRIKVVEFLRGSRLE